MGRFINLAGLKFERWTVIEYFGDYKWLCRCICGTERIVYSGNLKRGNTKSCGCLRKERAKQATFIDLTGQKFNMLTVLKHVGKNKTGISKWKCLCNCGKKKIILGNNLKIGSPISCGCYHGRKNHLIHGHARKGKRSRTYMTWRSMKSRCHNINSREYKNYGGRGITICPRWLGKNGFQNFLKDMGERPLKKSLDRINNNKGYYPNNCRWASPKEQNRNMRNNKFYYYNSKNQIIVDWAIETGIDEKTLRGRIRRKWSIKRALTTPV